MFGWIMSSNTHLRTLDIGGMPCSCCRLTHAAFRPAEAHVSGL